MMKESILWSIYCSLPLRQYMEIKKDSIFNGRSGRPSGQLICGNQKSDELMAYTYSHLYNVPATGLRFTVYGPFGRPDMAYFGFSDKIMAGKAIKIFNQGDMYRDFTYIDDIVEGVMRMLNNPPVPNEDGDRYKIYNIGNNKPEKLMEFIQTLEKALGREAKKEFYQCSPEMYIRHLRMFQNW